jgi:surface antigen
VIIVEPKLAPRVSGAVSGAGETVEPPGPASGVAGWTAGEQESKAAFCWQFLALLLGGLIERQIRAAMKATDTKSELRARTQRLPAPSP